MSFAREALRKSRSTLHVLDRPRSQRRLRTPPEFLPALIGEQLRRYYASLVSEPIPPHFVDLLKRMDSSRGDS
jgi:hypothetical protein